MGQRMLVADSGRRQLKCVRSLPERRFTHYYIIYIMRTPTHVWVGLCSVSVRIYPTADCQLAELKFDLFSAISQHLTRN